MPTIWPEKTSQWKILNNMLPYRDSRLTQITLGIFFLIVLGYAYFEVRSLLYGPRITIASGSTEVHEQFVVISGRADHITSLQVNGASVPVTTDGVFEVPYLLAPGLNRITFDARDNYEHTTSKTVEIVYIPSATSTTSTATSTLPGIPSDTPGTTSAASTSSDRLPLQEASSTTDR